MLSYYNAKYEEGASGQKTSGGRRFSKWKAGLRRRVLQKTREVVHFSELAPTTAHFLMLKFKSPPQKKTPCACS